jgi:SAM-dependent methyltransferase
VTTGLITTLDAADVASIDRALDTLINLSRCVLSYDRAPLHQILEILEEQYGIRSDADIEKNPNVRSIVQTFEARLGRKVQLTELERLLLESPSIGKKYRTTALIANLPSSEFDKWTDVTACVDRSKALALQKDLGMGAHNANKVRYDPHQGSEALPGYLRGVTTPPPRVIERLLGLSYWQIKLKIWQLRGLISSERPSLSVGPRWVTEIEFFRKIVGLKHHVGLDLFSDNPELIKAGDMHDMPLPNDHFDFIFVKNTTDKSYDVRKLVSELIRVVSPRGIIVIDQICGHGAVSPLHRTDIQSAANLLNLYRARADIHPLVCYDIDVRPWSADGSTVNARLAMQIRK